MKIFLGTPNVHLTNKRSQSLSPICRAYYCFYITTAFLSCWKTCEVGSAFDFRGSGSYNNFTTFIQSLTHCSQLSSVCCNRTLKWNVVWRWLSPVVSPLIHSVNSIIFSPFFLTITYQSQYSQKGQLIWMGICLLMKEIYHESLF